MEVEPSVTVGMLKQRIQVEHECRPPAEGIKLIYGGRLLHDGTSIREVLGTVSTTLLAALSMKPALAFDRHRGKPIGSVSFFLLP